MKKSVRFLVGLLVPAFMFAAVSSIPAFAQEKAKAAEATQKVLLDNEKAKVIEIRYKAGAVNTNVPRAARIVRAMTTGTLMRTYPDGKTEKVEWKAGDVRFIPAAVGAGPQYTTRNVGKSELVLFVVGLK